MAAPHPRLPPGLSPIDAGRLGLWLLATRSARRASLRVAFAKPRLMKGQLSPIAALLAPWSIYEYPGPSRFLAGLLGVDRATARRWMHANKPIPPKHAARLAAYLDSHAARALALAAGLRAPPNDPIPDNKQPQLSTPKQSPSKLSPEKTIETSK